MAFRIFEINAGAAVAEAEAITFIELASAGDPNAKSRLIYPTVAPAAPAFNPVSYFTNPDQRPGFDNNQIWNTPRNTLVETLDDHVLVSFEQNTKDRIVDEIWTAEGGKLSMPTSFLRELRNYHENAPDPEVEGFITWQPQNQGTKTYEVQLVFLQVGADVLMPMAGPEYKPLGGTVGGIAGPDGDLGIEFANAGWQTETITQRLRIVSELP